MSTGSRRSPDFLLFGVPKCGSTTLWYYLRQHPDVFMPSLKEPMYFCERNEHYGDWSWYLSLFEPGRDHLAVGEASVQYSVIARNPSAPERIARALPDARLLYIVRHPLKRLESAWRFNLAKGWPLPDSFSEAVRTHSGIVDATLYSRNLNAFRRYFSDEQILVLFLEDLKRSPVDMLHRCDAFLGVDPQKRPDHRRVEAINRTVDKGAPRHHVVRILLPLLARLNVHHLVPFGMRGGLRRLWRRPAPEAVWDRQTAEWALGKVREDSLELLSYAGKPPDYWLLTPDAVL